MQIQYIRTMLSIFQLLVYFRRQTGCLMIITCVFFFASDSAQKTFSNLQLKGRVMLVYSPPSRWECKILLCLCLWDTSSTCFILCVVLFSSNQNTCFYGMLVLCICENYNPLLSFLHFLTLTIWETMSPKVKWISTTFHLPNLLPGFSVVSWNSWRNCFLFFFFQIYDQD